jgi:hypothetical protein
MFGDHFGRVLDGVACLLVGAGLLKDVGGKNVPHIMRPMRKKTVDRAPPSKGVQDAVALDHQEYAASSLSPFPAKKRPVGDRPFTGSDA